MFMLEFPGVVIHIDKANRMLGGVTAITEVYGCHVKKNADLSLGRRWKARIGAESASG